MRPLTKTLYQVGVKCLRRLWLEVHESEACELRPTVTMEDRMRQANEVGQLARQQFPGGVLIPTWGPLENRIQLTQEALASGVTTIYEAAFGASNVYVAVDILERTNGALCINEVKASTSIKAYHADDLAIQSHVLSEMGHDPVSTHLLHLNPDYIHSAGDLFVPTDMTGEVNLLLPSVPEEIDRQLEALGGPQPACTIGGHCKADNPCPFVKRCWPSDPNHVRYLYRGQKRQDGFVERGIDSIHSIPNGEKLSTIQDRQARSVKGGTLIVESGLREELRQFKGTVGFLDFETIALAVPRWQGTRPWEQVPAQFSYHEQQSDGRYRHEEWLADGPEDSRQAFAEAVVSATANADSIAVYNAHFESAVIQNLIRAVPSLASDLEEIDAKLIDLLPMVRSYVYHPDFKGSFSIKRTLPALCPGLSYSALEVQDGLTASVEIRRLMFDAESMDETQRSGLRENLLAYCRLDTWAMVKLRQALLAMT